MKKIIISAIISVLISSCSLTKEQRFERRKIENEKCANAAPMVNIIKQENKKLLRERLIVMASFVTFGIQMKWIADKQTFIK